MNFRASRSLLLYMLGALHNYWKQNDNTTRRRGMKKG